MLENLLQVPAVGKRGFQYLAVQVDVRGAAVNKQLPLLTQGVIQLPAKLRAEPQ